MSILEKDEENKSILKPSDNQRQIKESILRERERPPRKPPDNNNNSGQNKEGKRLEVHVRKIGLCEVGLDSYINTCRESHRIQHHFLRQVSDLFIPQKHVLVLHCRDQGDGAASTQVLQLLTEKIPTDSRIHFHCFLGKLCQVTEWRKAFPKCYF